MNLADEITINQIQQELISQEDAKNWFLRFPTEYQQEILQWLSYMTTNFKGGTRHVIYPWNQSKIENRKSSSPRIYPWGQSKI